MLTPEQMAKKAQLTKAAEDAKALARATRKPEDRDAAVAASEALSKWIAENDPIKSVGYASRAGQRQHALMRAQYKK